MGRHRPGPGIGGLAAAAALARRHRRVLVLEQHLQPGGQTQTFRRREWVFPTGVHYLAGVGPQSGPEGQFGRLLQWLTDGQLAFAPCGNPYDIVSWPHFAFGIQAPETAYRAALLERFPHEAESIVRWFEACAEARRTAAQLFAAHSLPHAMASMLRWLRGAALERAAERTVADQLAGISDPRLRGVLGARWGDYSPPPDQAPFVEHAPVTGAYDGAPTTRWVGRHDLRRRWAMRCAPPAASCAWTPTCAASGRMTAASPVYRWCRAANASPRRRRWWSPPSAWATRWPVRMKTWPATGGRRCRHCSLGWPVCRCTRGWKATSPPRARALPTAGSTPARK